MASLLRNVGVNLFGFLGGRLASGLVGVLLLRVLRPEAAGIYLAAVAFAALFQSLSDLGLAACLTREVSAHPKQAHAWFSRGFQAQWAQLTVAALVLAAFLRFGGARGVEPGLVAMAFGTTALASLGSPVAAALQGQERFGLQALATLGCSLLNAAALAVLLLFGQANPRTALWTVLSSAALGLGFWAWAAIKGGLRFQLQPAAAVWGFWRRSLPFALVSAANQLYMRVDQALLVWLLGSQQLGYYVAAVRFVDLSVPVLGALNGPLYARLSGLHGRKAKAAKDDAARKLNLALRAMTAFCLPLGVGGSLLAGPLMALVFGADYAPSVPALVALAWVPALIGVQGSLLHGLNAVGQTARLAWLNALNLALNVGLNLWLVPRHGFVAAAWIWVLGECINLTAAWALARRAGLAPSLRAAFWPALPACAGLGFFCWALRGPAQAPLGLVGSALALVPLGALAYGLCLLALGFMGPEEKALWARLRGAR